MYLNSAKDKIEFNEKGLKRSKQLNLFDKYTIQAMFCSQTLTIYLDLYLLKEYYIGIISNF